MTKPKQKPHAWDTTTEALLADNILHMLNTVVDHTIYALQVAPEITKRDYRLHEALVKVGNILCKHYPEVTGTGDEEETQ